MTTHVGICDKSDILLTPAAKKKNRFELEALESRVLLSGDSVMAAAVAGAANLHHSAADSQVQMVVEHAAIQNTEFGSAGSDDIFAGMATEAVGSPVESQAHHHPAVDHSSKHTADQLTSTPAVERSGKASPTAETSQLPNSQVRVQVAASASVGPMAALIAAPRAVKISGSNAVALSNVATQQATATLTAANAPPVASAAAVSPSETAASFNKYTLQINASQVELLDQQGFIVSSQSITDTHPFVVTGSSTQDNLFVIQGSVLNQPGLAIQIQGGSGHDVLQVINDAGVTRQWAITGSNSGTVANVTFSSIEGLVGAANNYDTFTVKPGGVFDGEIDGGAGGFDTLVLQGVSSGSYTPGFVFGDGKIVAGQSQIQFTGLEPVVIDGSNVTGAGTGLNTSGLGASFTFNTPGSGNNITINSNAAGENTISGTSGGVAFESITFKNVASVTIDTSLNDGVNPSQGDTVQIVGDLAAQGLKQLAIKTGNGNDLIDLSQVGATGTVALTIDAGGGTNTLAAASAAGIKLTDSSLVEGTQSVATLSHIQNAELMGTADTSGFSGSAATLPEFPVLGQPIALSLTNGAILEQFFQSYGLTNDLSTYTAAQIASALGLGAPVNGEYAINLSKTLTFSLPLDLSILGGAITLSGNVSLQATVAVNLVFGVDANGFYIDSASQPANTPQVTINHLAINSANSLVLAGHFGLVDVSVTGPQIAFDSNVGLALSLQSDSKLYMTDWLAAASLAVKTSGSGTATSPDVTFSASVNLSSVFGNTTPQTFVFTWANLSQSALPTLGGAGMDYLRLKLTQLSQVLANGLVRLQSQAGALSDLIDNSAVLNTQLPLVNTTLLSVLNLGTDLNSALGVGSTVSAYLSQLNTSTDRLAVPTTGVFVLTDGKNYAALNFNATAAQIQSALEGFASIGAGNVTVTAGTTTGTFNIQLQPLTAGANATSLRFPNLAAVSVAMPTLKLGTTGFTLTVTATSGTYILSDGTAGGTQVITANPGSPLAVSGLSLNLSPVTLVQSTLNPGSFTIGGGGVTTSGIALAVSASAIEDALNASTAFGAGAYQASVRSDGTVNIIYLGSGTAPTLSLSEVSASLSNNGVFTPGYITFSGKLPGTNTTVTTGHIVLSPSTLQSALNTAFASYYSADKTTAKPNPFTFTTNADGTISITYNGGTNTNAPNLTIKNPVSSTFQASALFTLGLGNFTLSGTVSNVATTTGSVPFAIADGFTSTTASVTPGTVLQNALDSAFGTGVFTVSTQGAAFTITYAGSGANPALSVNQSLPTLVNGVLTPGFITLTGTVGGVTKTTAPIYLVAGSNLIQTALNNAFKTQSVTTPFSVAVATTSVTINYNATAAQIQTALATLTSIGAGNIKVTAGDTTAGHLTFTIAINGSLVALPPQLAVTGTGVSLAPATTSTSAKYLYLTPGAAGDVFVLGDGTTNTVLSVYASAGEIQSALEAFAGIGPNKISVTPVSGLPGAYLIKTLDGSALPSFQVAAGSLATVEQDVVPFTFPTVQGLVDILNSSLSSALAGTPISIVADYDATTKTLNFDVHLDFAATYSTNLSFGSGFSALGLTLGGNVPVTLAVSATLDFTTGVDLSGLTASNTTLSAANFFVQFNQVTLSGSIALSDINIGIAGAIGPASGSLSLVGGSATLSGSVDLGFGTPLVGGSATYANDQTYQLNGLTPGAYYFWAKGANDTSLQVDGATTLTASGIFQATQASVTLTGAAGQAVTASVNARVGRIPFNQLGGITSIVSFMPAAAMSLNLPITGALTGPGFALNGTFTVTVPTFNFFAGGTPEFTMTFEGGMTIANYFQAEGSFAFASTSGNLVRNDGVQYSNANYLLISGANINVFAGNANGQTLDQIFAGNLGSATGLVLSNLNFSLLLFTDASATPAAVNYTALQTSGGTAAFVGVSGLTLGISNFSVKLDQTSDTANPNRVLDFNRGGKVIGNPVTPVTGPTINMEGEAGSTLTVTGSANFNAFDVVSGSADLALTRQVIDVELAGAASSLANDTLLANATLLNFSMTNVSLFAGVNGTTGFSVTGGSLGLAVILANPAEITGDTRMYLALTARLGSAGMVGLPDGMVINASNLTLQVNKAFGSVTGSATATPLDWTTALDLNADSTFGDSLTFFTGTAQASPVNFTTGFTQVSGTLTLQFSSNDAVVLQANATFTMTVQTVNVNLNPGTNATAIDLHQAQLLTLDLQLFDPDALRDSGGNILSNGPQRALIVGNPSGFGFAVDSGELVYAQLTPNADASQSPSGFNRTYYALTATVTNAALTGLPTGFTVQATQLNFALNQSQGAAVSAPAALDWTTMVDTNASDTTFQSSAVTVGGNAIQFTAAEFSVSGNLVLNLQGFVLGSGSFAFTQTGGQTISDGTALTTAPLTGVTLQEIVVSNVNLFVGVNGAFGAADANGNPTIDTTQGTGFSVSGANLVVVTATETTGQQRSWLGVMAQIGQMQVQGLPAGSLTMVVQSLSLLYNAPDKTTGTRLNWAGVTVGSGVSNPTLSAYFNALNQSSLDVSQLVSAVSFSVSGSMYLNVASSVIVSGTFSVTQQTGVAVNDGTISLANAAMLVVRLSDANLFVGTGGVTTPTTGTLYQPNAMGFSASGINLDLAIVRQNPADGKLTWVGLAANLQSMTVVGPPSDFTVNVQNLTVLDNLAATNGSRLNWQALAEQTGNPFGLGTTMLTGLSNAATFSVNGTMTISIQNYVYVNGAFALSQKLLSTTTEGSSTFTPMSALIFGATNVHVFVGNGGPYWMTDANGNVVADPNSKAVGMAVTVDNLGLVLMRPVVSNGAPASTKSYFALQASGSATLVGIANVTLTGQLNVSLNQARDTALTVPSSAPAINFAASAAASPVAYGSSTGLKVITGTGTTNSVLLDFSTKTLSASGLLSLGISQFVYATGNFSIQQSDSSLVTPGTVTLAGGGTVTGVSVLTIGASNVNVFIGTGGPYFQDSNGDGVINGSDTPATAGATGVAFSNISLGLALMSSQTNASSFYALQASGSGQLVGVSGVTMSAQNMVIQVNGGSVSSTGPPVAGAVDFLASFGASGLALPTGGGSSISLQYSSSLLSVSGSVTLNIGNNVYISGSMSFTQGGTVTATLSDGTTKQVSVLTVGASSVNVFMGANGPAGNAGAMGISITGGSFALALLTPTDARDASRYYAVQATGSFNALTGLSGFQLTVTALNVLVNGSTGTTVPNQVVDFSKTDWLGNGTPAGYLTVATGGGGTINLSAAQKVIEASGTVTASLLSGVVQLSGSVALKISQQTVVLSDSTSLLVNALEIGLANGTATITPTPGNSKADSASLSGVTLGLAYYTPANPATNDKRSWLGLQTYGGSVTGGTGSVKAGVSNLTVSLNQGYGTLAGKANATVVNFPASFSGALAVDTGGINAVSGDPITVSLGFAEQIVSLSAQVQLSIGNFFYAQGVFTFTSGGSRTVNLVDVNGNSVGTVTVTVQTLGISNASVFAGNVGDGGFYLNPDGTMNATDVGFVLSGVNFVVVKLAATDGSGREWTAVEASASSASLVGLSGFSLAVTSVQVQVNTGNASTNNTFVNFDSSYAPQGSTTGGNLTISTGGTSAPLNIGYAGKVLQVQASATLSLGSFVYLSGTFDFTTGGTATATLSDGTTKAVSIMTVGASDVNIFVGTGGPYFQDSNGDGVINSSDTPAAAGAMGLAITDASFGLALLKPTNTTDTSSYYALSAMASKVALVGLGNDNSGNPLFALAVNGLTIQVNGGTDAQKPNRAVNFATTQWDGTANPAPGFLAVATGGTPVNLDFANRIVSVSATNAVISIAGFVQVEGGFSFSQSASVLATLSDGTTKSVAVTTIAFTNVSAFVGAGPYFMVDNSGNILGTNSSAAGVLLTNANLSIALFKPTNTADSSSYYAVSASASGISLPGIDVSGGSDSFSFSAGTYLIQVSGGTNGVGVNFAATYPGNTPGLQVGNALFDFTSPLQQVSIIDAVLNISDYVYISGSFTFIRQTSLNVTLSDSTPLTAVTAYAFGAANVDVFVGSSPNGPAFENGVVDSAAVGLVLQNVNFGLIVMKPTDSAHQNLTFIALKATANYAGLVGIDGFTLSASGINVELNTVTGSSNPTNPPVVDFTKMTGGSYAFNFGAGPLNPVGNGTLVLDYQKQLLLASVDNATLQIGSYVFVQGSFFFQKGAAQDFYLNDSTHTKETMSAIEIGASNVNMFFGVGGPYVDATTTPNAVGLSIQGGSLALALLTPLASTGDPHRYLALDTQASLVAFVGAGSNIFNFSAANIDVQLNLATGSGATAATPVIDFTQLAGGSYAVPTGTTTPAIDLAFKTRLIHASADNVLVTVSSFLYVNGSVAFDMGSQQTVTINTGIPLSLVATLGQSTVNAAISAANSALQALSSGLDTLQDEVKAQLTSAINTVQSTIMGLESSVIDTIANTIQTQLTTALASAQSAVTSSLTQALNSATSSLSVGSLVDSLLAPIVNVAPDGPLRNLLSTMLDPIKSLISAKFGDVIQQAVTGSIDRIAGSVATAINAGVLAATNDIKAKIKAALDPQFARITTQLNQLVNQLGGELAPLFTQLQAFAGLQIGPNFATLSGVVVNVTTIGISNGNAFVGLGFDPTKSVADQVSANLTGLMIQNLNLGLAMFKPVSSELPSFTAVKLTATSVSLQIGSTSDITLSANNVEVDLNLGGSIIPGTGALLGNATINFKTSFETTQGAGDGQFAVPTGTTTPPIYLDYSSELIQASVARATLNIFGFVYVTGSFAFQQGQVQTVNVTGGLTSAATAFLNNLNLPAALSIPATGATTTTLSFLTVGAADVHAFIGVGGPYWMVDGNNNVVADPNSKAVGLVVNDFNFGLAMMRPTNPLDFERYFALQASATNITLVGVPGVTVTANHLLVSVNESSPSVYGVPLFPVVDFANTPQFASEELPLFDTNHDGRITLGELASLPGAANFTGLNGVSKTDTTVVDEVTLAAILNSDTNANSPSGKGVVTVNEAADLLGGTPTAQARAKAADVNGDGIINPGGYKVITGGTPVYLNMDSPLILAQGFLDLNVAGVVVLRGSFAFELGPTVNVSTVDLQGNTGTDSVMTLTIGASNVSAFVGWGGGFDPNNPTSSALQAGAKGLLLRNLNVGIFVGLSVNDLTNPRVYFALQFSVDSIGIVGLDFINADATLSVSINVGAGITSALPVIDFAASFPAASPGDSAGFKVNTGDPLHPVVLDFTGFLVNVQIAGGLTIHSGGTDFVEMQGIFYLNLDSSGFELFVAADLRVGADIGKTTTPLLGISALGVLIINGSGIAADFDVNLQLNVPGISVAVAARIILNTTGAQQGIALPDRIMNYLQTSTSPLAARLLSRLGPNPSDASVHNYYSISQYAPDIANSSTGTTTIANLLSGTGTIGYTTQTNYVVGVITGTVTFAGFATATGTAGIVISSTGFQLYVNLGFQIGISGISLNFSAVGIVSISSAGLYLNVNVALNADLTTLFHVNASGTLLIDTTGTTTRFYLSLNGSLTIASVLTISGSFSINVGAGGPNTWRIAMSLSGSLGPITLTASGWIQSDGQFDLRVSGSIYLGVDGFSISGGVSGEVSLIKSGQNYVYHSGDTYTLTVIISGYVTLDIIGIDFGASVTLGGSATIGGSSTTLTLYASGSVTILGITYSGGGTVATISIPNTIFVSTPPPNLATVSNGVLSLNVGSTAYLRNVNASVTDEAYVLTDLGGGVVQVQAFGYTETYTGVSSVSANFGDGTDSLTLNSGFSLPVTATGGNGTHTFTSYGSGAITWHGGGGVNTIVGGSGNDTIYAGSGTNYLTGGLGNDTIYNQAGGLAYIFGETGSFTFDGSSHVATMSSTITGSVPGNNTIWATTGTNYIIGGRGSDTIHGGGTNYVIGDIGTFGFTSGVLNTVIAGAASATGVDAIDAGSNGTNVITLTANPATGANTFTLAGSSWSGTLQGAGGNNRLVEITPAAVAGAVTYVLSDSALTVTGGVTQNLTLKNIQAADLAGASTTSNTFNLTGWTGSGSLTAPAGAANQLVATNDVAAFTLTDSSFGRAGMGTMTLSHIQTATLTGGASANTFNVSNWSGTVNLDGVGGSDYYNLTLSGVGPGTFVVADSGSASGDVDTLKVVVSANTLVTTNTVHVGALQLVTYSGVEQLNVNGAAAGLTYYLQSLLASVSATLTTTGGANAIYVGSTAGNTLASPGVVGTIQGALKIAGGGTDTLTLDNTLDANPETLTQTVTALTGLGMGAQGIQYSGISVLNLNLGNGGNTVFIRGNPAITTENLDAGAGVNIISLGSLAPAVIGSPIMDITNPLDGQVTNTGSVMDNVRGVINIANDGLITLNVDDSGSLTGIAGGLWSNKLQFLNAAQTAVQLTVNFAATTDGSGTIISGVAAINLSLSQGADSLVIVDTIKSSAAGQGVMIYGNAGNDTFLIFDTHALTSVFGGAGADNFYNFGNSAVLNLFGNAGDDSFFVYASLVANTTNVTPGTSDQANQVYTYRVNARVNIDGGAGNNIVYVFGTVLDDTFIITSTGVTGSGLDIAYTNIQKLYVAGLQGNDTFYIESISIPTTVIGDGTIVLPEAQYFLNALGVSLPDTTGGATPSTSFSDTFYVGWRGVDMPGSLADIQAALTIYGDNGPNQDGTTTSLPNTDNRVFVDDTADTANQSFTLTPGLLVGSAMGPAGQIIYDSAIEHFNVSLGAGNDSLAIQDMIFTTVTTIDGGAGNNDSVMTFSGDFSAVNLTLLNFQTNRLFVAGNFTGLLNDQGAFSTVTILGSMTVTGIFNAGAIDIMTVGGDLAGLLDVTNLLNSLAIQGGSPGKIIAGAVNYISVQSGFGNKVFQVIEGGIERQIQATPVAGGTLTSQIRFAFLYDSLAPGDPQLALSITNHGTVSARSFNVVLAVINSQQHFNLAVAYAAAATGLGNLAVEGDLLFHASAAGLNFLGLPTDARTGVVMPFDYITGVEISGILPIGKVVVAGIEGVAFGLVQTMAGQTVNILGDLKATGSQPNVLWNLLGSRPVLMGATDTLVVPFTAEHSVQVFAQCNTNQTFEYVLTLSTTVNTETPIVANVTVLPGKVPQVQNIAFVGDGGSVDSRYGVNTITSTGELGDVTVRGKTGLGSITAPNIIGNINIIAGAITGAIQTTGVRVDPVTGVQTTVSADIGTFVTNTQGQIIAVTTIFAAKGFTGDQAIICRGNLISTVRAGGVLHGVIAVQGNVGAILTNPDGTAFTAGLGILARFGGITLGGLSGGQIIALGNAFGDIAISGTFNGRIAVEGAAVAGLDATRNGILGQLQIRSASAGAVIVSGGQIGDVLCGTTLNTGTFKGFVAVNGAVQLANARSLAADRLFAHALNTVNGSVINAIFTNLSRSLSLDTGGSLAGLALIQSDLAALAIENGQLTGPQP